MSRCAAPECTKPRSGRSRHCAMHQARLRRTGTFDPGRFAPRPAEERFWSKVSKSDGCWTWTGHSNARGYGQVSDDARRLQYAHRFSWALHHGPIPDGLLVMHVCDNPPCVRPDHLTLGTHEDNMRDMVSKGRSLKGYRREAYRWQTS